MNCWAIKIEKYFNGTSRYPLMIVSSSKDYKQILSDFSDTAKIKVSDYCASADKEPDTLQLESDIRNKSGNYILIGLGDFLASKTSIAKKTLSSYKDLILKNDGRVVILLSPYMYPYIKEIVDSDPRVKMRFLLPKDVPIIENKENGILVYGIKAYLDACEKCESVCSVKTERHLQNVNIVNTQNPFEELKHRFPNEFNRLSQNAGTPEYWSKLLVNLNKSNLSMAQYLAGQGFDSLDYVFLYHAKKETFESWLYFIYLKLNVNSQSYLGLVTMKSDNLKSLFQNAKTAILDISKNDSVFNIFYEQRKKMLKGCTDVDMADYVPTIQVRGADRLAYLTDNTKIERQAAIVSLCEGASSDRLEISYPDLYFYLSDYHFEDDRFTKYFSEYRKCKLGNKIANDFARKVMEYAVIRPYNSLPARSALISCINYENTVLVFLDAFGAEYLGFVKEKCAELKLRFSTKIARANLPTITSVNREFYDEWKGKKEVPIKDLDELKHHSERGYNYNNSPYPIHLAEELEVIKTALERAKIKLSTGECRKVLIASDHGASRLAVISANSFVHHNDCEVKSSGRYCVGNELPEANNIVREVGCDYAIIADYSRFENSRAASVEVHGGATLEEVVVPIIELTSADNNIQVSLEKNVIEISYKIIPKLVFIITPDCEDVTVLINQTNYKVEKLERSKYKVEMHDLKKGTYKIDFFENQNKIDSKEITIKSKGFAERDIF